MASKKLSLSKPIEIHDEIISELEFKEPTGAIFLDLGEPRILSKSKDDILYLIDNDAVIKDYMHRCVMGEHGQTLLHMLNLKDARAARELVLSFFTDADQAI